MNNGASKTTLTRRAASQQTHIGITHGQGAYALPGLLCTYSTVCRHQTESLKQTAWMSAKWIVTTRTQSPPRVLWRWRGRFGAENADQSRPLRVTGRTWSAIRSVATWPDATAEAKRSDVSAYVSADFFEKYWERKVRRRR